MKKNNYIEVTLKNGVKVYLYKDKNLKRTYVSYNIKYGTNGYFDKFYYEDKPYKMQPAMAHFLEHYLIEHSKNGNMLHRFLDKNYEFNGLTYPEVTSYYFLGIEDIKESIKELIEMVDEPNFNEESTEIVKNAIIEELSNISDSKYRIAFSNNRNNLHKSYAETPIDNNVLGSVKSTKKFTCKDIETAYNAYYNDENKFIVIAGNINVNETINYLEEIFSNIKNHPNYMREYDYGDNFELRKDREVIEMHGDSDFIIVTYKEKILSDIPQIKQDLCLNIYHQLKKTYLLNELDKLTEKNIILGEIGYSVDFFKGRLSISYYADSHNTKEFEKFLEKQFNFDGLDENNFELIKKGLIVSELKSKDYIYGKFKSLPTNVEFSKNIDEIDLIESITLDDVKEIVSRYKFDLKCVTIITPKK